MEIDYGQGSPSFKLARFKATKKHHELSHTKLLKMYRVNGTTLSNTFFAAIGRKTRVQMDRERKERIMSHPGFGSPGCDAPIPLASLARQTGASKGTAHKLRTQYGVLPCPRVAHNKGYAGSPPPSVKERAVYKLCRKTHNWGRPKGMAEHLESLA